MKLFQINDEKWKVRSVKSRPEFHGEDRKIVADVHFEGNVSNEFLDMLCLSYRPRFYTKKSENEQDMIDKISDVQSCTEPAMKDISNNMLDLNHKFTARRLIIPQGISGEKDIILLDLKISGFKFKPKPGAIAHVIFMVSAPIHQGDGHELGYLALLAQEEVDLTIEPHSAEDHAQKTVDAFKEGLDEEDQDDED